ncbi:excalibur calcium-binding domain-containing protein [Nocardia vinacea]|uniref:excalibur calcium-binding domain-containing protein n=1 Tax=Nocardia vinacea TaxID=96468 RepID=UPI002E10F4B8
MDTRHAASKLSAMLCTSARPYPFCPLRPVRLTERFTHAPHGYPELTGNSYSIFGTAARPPCYRPRHDNSSRGEWPSTGGAKGLRWFSFAAPTATADPLTDLLCNSGSAQFCPPTQPQQNLPNNPPPQAQPPQALPPQTQPAPYYKNCDEVRRAGKAPLHRGDPGYAAHLDRDNDGIACE